jgi:pimeloyl-ACP methyl ester carboxylesterase/class 3 adenylate cyclase
MGLAPKVQFVHRGDADLAYQVFGEGPANLLYVLIGSHLEQIWQFPSVLQVHERLASMARIAMYDQRGYGMSDRLPAGGYPIEELAADALAVMDAAGFERAFLLGDGLNGAVAIWLAAHYPERFDGLILKDTSACFRAHAGYDIGLDDAEYAERRAFFQTLWGTGATIHFLAPSLAHDERLVEEWARYERLIATPNSMMVAFDVGTEMDVRDLLPQVSMRTLVIHSAANVFVPVSQGRYIGQHIPDARYVEVDFDPALDFTTGGILGDLAEFLTGSRVAAHIERSLQVVLFSDIAGSTERAVAVGDDAWRHLLIEFRSIVRAILDRYQAREVNTRGDDFFVVVTSPSIAVEIARAIRTDAAGLELQVRSGLHLGEIEHQGDDFAGVAVHIGARISALAEAGEILVSQTVRDALVGSGIEWTPRGVHHLKGVPDEWRTYAVVN